MNVLLVCFIYSAVVLYLAAGVFRCSYDELMLCFKGYLLLLCGLGSCWFVV